MNQELINMAKQAGIFVGDGPEWDFFKRQYAKFAALVAAAEREFWIEQSIVDIEEAIRDEREACAKIVEPTEEHRRDASWGYVGGEEGVELLDGLVKQIRARGETK